MMKKRGKKFSNFFCHPIVPKKISCEVDNASFSSQEEEKKMM